MRLITYFTPITAILLFLNSCLYEKESDLVVQIPPETICDTCTSCDTCDIVNLCITEKTDSISFELHILPILETNCFGCHNEANANSKGSGYEFDTYTEISNFTKNGLILPQVKHESGATPMPYNKTKLDECSINTLQIWIEQGSLNN